MTGLQVLTFLIAGVISTSCSQLTQKPRTYANSVTAPDQQPAADSVDSQTADSLDTPAPGGDPLLAIHDPKPASCNGCHEAKRPAANHYVKHDCATCHTYPNFKMASFAHNPKPETCEDCHARPATLGLRAFPNQGPPAGFNPNNPAEIGGGHYRGKDCAGCHATPAEGAQVFTFTHSKPNPNMCLPCHYDDGLGQHHGEADIMLSGLGNCATCHRSFDRNVDRNFDLVE